MVTPWIDQIRGSSGYFRVSVHAPGGALTDITKFRGKPIQINSLSSVDPFGDATAQLTFPQISGFERPGSGDLWWMVPWVMIDIAWYNDDGSPTTWVWEGFMVSEEITEAGLSITLKGALFELDNYKAKPWFPQQPVPYELLIKDSFDPTKRIGLRTSPLRIEFPEGWKTVVPKERSENFWYLTPWGIKPGKEWTGFTTRNTGSWDNLLTGFVQTLLSIMYTEDGGQWTVKKETGRTPVLKIRPEITSPNAETLHVWYGAPSVELSLSRDFTQSTNVIYGAGSDLAGSAFSGQQVTADGQTTYYEPFAALPSVYPAGKDNPRINDNVRRNESRLEFPSGMSQLESRTVAEGHLRKFADPGYTGQLRLTTDPLRGGIPYNRLLIRAGQGIVVHGVRGADMLFHITESNVSPMDMSVSLTLDTKYRDAKTVYEVRAMTRDALDPVRLLKVGAYSVQVQDQILPWSYSHGSGIIPSGGGAFDASNLFLKLMNANEKFPWTNATKKYPPRKYPSFYIKIPKRSSDANLNWSGVTKSGLYWASLPIRMSQAGTIRLTQIAAYDEDGNVLPCRFHVSFYGNSGTTVQAMPAIPASQDNKYGPAAPYYKAAQRYPFFPGAFEAKREDGTDTNNPMRTVAEGSDLWVGFGNYYEGAGYWPGRQSKGGPKTGMLSEEQTWGFDTTGAKQFDKYRAEKTRNDPLAGLGYIMIYCDDQGTKPVYFLGRLFRAEGGT
jgi:hypothetical protein